MAEKKRKGVAFNKAKGYYIASIYSKGRNYHLGSYKEFDAAVAIREQAESHLKTGDLPEWYAEFRSKNIKSTPSSHPGVYMTDGKWASTIYLQGKIYYLGFFKAIEDAIEIREEAEQHKESGDFLDWYKKRKATKRKKTHKHKKWRCYKIFKGKRYELGLFETLDEAVTTRREAEQHIEKGDFLEWFKAYKASEAARRKELKEARQNTWTKLVKYNKHQKKYRAFIKCGQDRNELGRYDTEQEAENICKEALQHMNDGDFDLWYTALCKKIEDEKLRNDGIYYYKNIDKWLVRFPYKGKRYTLGSFSDKDDAITVKLEALQHTDDFLEWYTSQYLKKTDPQKNPRGGVYKNGGSWKAQIHVQGKLYYLGSFRTKEDAGKIFKEAEIHMDDFEDWYRTYYSNYKAKKNAVKGGVYYSKRYDAWKAKIYYKGDLYYLGQFKAKSEAEELLYEAQKHYHTDFMEWYLTLCSEKYVSRRNVYGFVYQNQNRNSVTWRTQFKIHGMFYFLGTYGTEEDAKKILREAESHVDDFEDWYYAYHDNYTALENASRGGVYYNKSADAWKSQISYQGQLYYLGQFKVKTKAEELLNEAQNHYYTDFLEWFEDMKKERKRSPRSGVKRSMPEETIHQIKDGTDESDSWGNIYRRKNGWVVQGSFQGKLYYLGKYEIKEDAEKVLKEAGAHVTDFEDWYENYYVQGYLLAKRGGISYNETSNTWKVQIHYKDKLYYLGLFQTKSEAEEMLKEAQEHYHTDFLEWYEENRRKRKKIVHQV